ncbi:SRPBCC domain-containing protein [Chitiniphilus eburneus]|uniref:SRPBCC family protein n=1 Tax=Chitiniphilus eburneus TaxID=2571148 RepID=UPI0035D065A7
MSTPNFVRIVRRLDAPPQRVFEAWLDPQVARHWLFTSPISEHNITEIDARVGGAWRITDRREGVAYTGIGEYLEIAPPRRIVFTFAMPQFSPAYDRIDVEIEPDGGASVLTVTQHGLPPDFNEATEAGWNLMFDTLAAWLARD